ncbi:MAG: DNA topoisomerase VI subunit B [Candidatus Latescibacterota bacterium]|nr:MAG: DNA topoisomerase VI subunit B [Candidatus Latescibacterota bacterium]
MKQRQKRGGTAAGGQPDLFQASAEPKKTVPLAVVAEEPAPPKRAGASKAPQQREISVSEFFAKNRHLLGFDNPSKALLTTVKEAVDNSLDACEEASILARVEVRIDQLAEDRFRVAVEDNGPGIARKEAPRIFGSLLYGSKFHRLRQSRGQQGIGISAAGMYGQMTTGKPMIVVSRLGAKKPAHRFSILLDTKKNLPVVASEEEIEWEAPHGTRVEIELEASYKAGYHSVDRYLRQVSLANPHAEIVYHSPKGEAFRYERTADSLPVEAKEIKPHPRGVELGTLMKMLKETRARNVRGFLTAEFSRVSGKIADEILAAASLRPETSTAHVPRDAAEVLYRAIQKTKIMNPPTNCLSPIGEKQLMLSLQAHHKPEFVTAITRPAAVYRGNPFLIEAALAFGGPSFEGDQPAELYRFANRVPLQYQKSACAITKSAIDVAWKNYMVSQSRGALPVAPMAIAVHIASVWVPFTSESKEAIASYTEISTEIRLALQECGRKLGAYIRRGRRIADAEMKQSYIEKYLPHIGIALQEILGLTDDRRDRRMAELKTILEKSRRV